MSFACRPARTPLRLALFLVLISLFDFFPAGFASTRNCPDGPTLTENGKLVQATERQMRLWCNGIEAFENKNYELGYELLMPFAKSGDPAAKFLVGLLLLRGLLHHSEFFARDPADANKVTGLPLDVDLGLRMIREAAAADEPKARLLLAALHLAGAGVAKDEKEGLRLAEEVARQGEHYAYMVLYSFYDEKNDFSRSYKWLYLFFNCHPNPLVGRAYWTITKRAVFEQDTGRSGSISSGEKLIEEWKKAHGNKLCPG